MQARRISLAAELEVGVGHASLVPIEMSDSFGVLNSLRSLAMAEDTQMVTIKDGGREFVVRVIMEAPSLEGLDVQSLAQQAWHRPGKMLRTGDLTVVVARPKKGAR